MLLFRTLSKTVENQDQDFFSKVCQERDELVSILVQEGGKNPRGSSPGDNLEWDSPGFSLV